MAGVDESPATAAAPPAGGNHLIRRPITMIERRHHPAHRRRARTLSARPSPSSGQAPRGEPRHALPSGRPLPPRHARRKPHDHRESGRQRENCQRWRKGRQADSARRRQRVIAALDRAVTASGAEISVSAIARAAGVDRTFLYRHRDLLEKIHALEASPATGRSRPDRPSPVRPCKPTCSPPMNARCGSWTPVPGNSNNGFPKRLGSRRGTNQGSVPPPTSMPSTRRSPTSNSKPPTCGSSSANATRTSTPPAPPTASSWPRSTLPRTRHRHAPEVLAPHLSHTVMFSVPAAELRKHGEQTCFSATRLLENAANGESTPSPSYSLPDYGYYLQLRRNSG